MKIIKGDLLDLASRGYFDVIIHGCNCFCTMGAGIAKEIRIKYPNAYKKDLETISGDLRKLGKITLYKNSSPEFYIINAYTQYNYSGKNPLDYGALRCCFKNIHEQFGDNNLKFGIPQIGCGLAGGDWNIVKDIIDEEMKSENVTCVIYNK